MWGNCVHLMVMILRSEPSHLKNITLIQNHQMRIWSKDPNGTNLLTVSNLLMIAMFGASCVATEG